MGGAILLLATIGAGAFSSYYTVRLDDRKAVYLTRERFGAVGDGVADDTAALQKAIDAAQETTGEGVVFVPEGHALYAVRICGPSADDPGR